MTATGRPVALAHTAAHADRWELAQVCACASSAREVDARKDSAVLRWRSSSASEKQNSANAPKPLSRPRSIRNSCSVPRCACVNVAITVAMIGNGASSPLTWGPSQPATAVSVSTRATAHAARSGRSHAGGFAGGRCSVCHCC